MFQKPKYVYVASSWRNPIQPVIIDLLKAAEIDCYDFRNPEGGTGFSWAEVKPDLAGAGIPGKGSDWESTEDYIQMINHPRAWEGFAADFAAMEKADTFILLLPCGKSAHLELGWAVGADKRTAILLEDPVEPELMYKMVDYMATTVKELLTWLEGRERMSSGAFTEGSEKAFEKSEAATAAVTLDTFPQWMRWRYGSRPYTTGDPSKGWDDLSDTDKEYWEHEAAAVKRAVARDGFKEKR